MKNSIQRFLRDERGATAIEYGLIAGLIAIAIATAVSGLGTNLTTFFNGLAGKVSAWASGATSAG
ncbi:pilus assembly protein [Cupriavidus sp. USMAA2-4]|uniref:Flp family type IVb pilin n=1 Tax=unclassified Cupriavidus TaxID=2640874 RepID=UPI0008A6FA48|nr:MULTISPECIES: Flp family type IVb pilin [unclassified Cupriavidus]AOY95276.1 pilus assembly protein [Cupriavidus sp. USMAA2-4]AOZ01823.1 pilus assembly protein [Cupriavidus sp. USMAHM13]